MNDNEAKQSFPRSGLSSRVLRHLPPRRFGGSSFVLRLWSSVIRRAERSSVLEEVDPQTGYDLWSATYDADEAGNPVLSLDRATLETYLPPLKGQGVLDMACGTGHYAVQAASAGARLAVGIDRSAGMLRQARDKAVERRTPVALVQAEQSRLPLASTSLDVVVHALGAGYTRDLGPLAGELARVLRPGGTALVSDLHPQGVQRGWRRTFSYYCGTRRQAILKTYGHRMEEYRVAFEQAGLSIANMVEPCVNEALRPCFAAAGARTRYEQLVHQPLLVVFELQRSG
jgi:ubiquinone/menaquinone biosynthesis C-methylase UbiE